MKYHQLNVFLKSFKIFSEEDLKLIKRHCKFRKAMEGEIMNRGELAGKVFFVNNGSIRAYYYKDDEQITRMITWENRVLINICEIENYYGYEEIIECLEDTEVVYITKEDFDILVDKSVAFRDFAFRLLEMHLLRYVEKSHYMGMDTKSKMYYLKTYYRPLIGRVKDSVLASFLSISREHFVRNKKYL